jgi:TatD DNase family protein
LSLLYDSHVHLSDAEYSGYMAQILSSLYAMRIVACCVTVDLSTTQKSFKLFSNHRKVVRQFIGIHPEFAAKEDIDMFLQVAKENRPLLDGIGEIGLDGTYEAERGISYKRQKEVFHAMLALAECIGRPVSIHSRRALDDILEILPSYRLSGALLHWFAGSKKQLAKAMDTGLYVSYGPALVYSDDKKVLLKQTDKDRILFETDGPVRYSRCFEGRPALPTSFLPSVVASAAWVIGLSYKEVVCIVAKNTEVFLGSQQL